MLRIKLNSSTWCKLTGIFILDADGWDRSNFFKSWDERIDFNEFYDRFSVSTSSGGPHGDYDKIKAKVTENIEEFLISGNK